MDRKDFLSSISFLCPVQIKKQQDADDEESGSGKHDGDRNPSAATTTAKRCTNDNVETILLSSEKCCMEKLISNHQVSIEPIDPWNDASNNDHTGDDSSDNADLDPCTVQSLGPAYFSKRSKNEQEGNDGEQRDQGNDEEKFDPAMCSFDLTLYHADLPEQLLTTPIKDMHQRQRTLFGWISPPHEPKKEEHNGEGGNTSDDNPTSIIDNDGDDHDEQDQDEEKGGVEDVEEEEEAIAASTEAILIATIDGHPYAIDVTSLIGIKCVGSRDFDASNDEDTPSCLILQFPSFLLRIFSYSDNGTNDVENNLTLEEVEDRCQKLLTDEYFLPYPLEYDGLICTSANVRHKVSSIGLINSSVTVDETLQSSQTYIESFFQAWTLLNLLGRVLSVPQENRNNNDSSLQEYLKSYLKEMLGRIPSTIALSVMDVKNVSIGMQAYNHKINTKLDSLDDVFESFWKTSLSSWKPGNRKRRRGDQTKKRSHEEVQQDCIDQTREFLTKHKELLSSKYELSLLPYR